MPESDAQNYRFHPFDLTKIWSHKDYPLIDVGVLELNRNPENYHAEVEQAAFNPGSIVPGIGFSPDKMLQGRLFSYGDAQRYRLGVNHAQIPVNTPRCPYQSFLARGSFLRHTKKVVKTYRSRMRQLRSWVVAFFPHGTRVSNPQGGFVLWVELPDHFRSIDVYQQALRQNIAIAPGILFSSQGQYQHHIRLSCGAVERELARESIKALGELMTKL